MTTSIAQRQTAFVEGSATAQRGRDALRRLDAFYARGGDTIAHETWRGAHDGAAYAISMLEDVLVHSPEPPAVEREMLRVESVIEHLAQLISAPASAGPKSTTIGAVPKAAAKITDAGEHHRRILQG